MTTPALGTDGAAGPRDHPCWSTWVADQLAYVRRAGRWRQTRSLDGPGPEFTLPDGTDVISFASNDYLGLSQHPDVIAAAHQALNRYGTGAGASRLVVGSRPIHSELEAAIAAWRDTARALMFPTGYAANLAVLSTLGRGARIISDELNHASIFDGARLTRSKVCAFHHGDADHAARLVRDAPGRALVVTETVFSMDGDVAPVGALSALCARTTALLVLDDAHAVLETPEAEPEATCIRIGTCSKSLGSLGGYVAGAAAIIDLLVNRSRTFIFTTAPTPADTAAALAAITICRSPEGHTLRQRLRNNIDTIRPDHPSPIIPVILGDEATAMATSASLLGQGLLVPAIRPPTVPPGTSRLRISISAAHTPDQLAALAVALPR